MKVTLKVEGMSCGMCEAHVCETIRKADSNLNEYELAKAIEETGYTCTGMDVDQAAIGKSLS